MGPKSLAVAAIALSSFVSAYAIPVTILQRVPSGSAPAPAPSSFAPAPASTAAQPAPSSAPPASTPAASSPPSSPSSPPAASSPPSSPSSPPAASSVIEHAVASVVVGAIESASAIAATMTTTPATTTTTSAPTETWSIVVEVGSNQFNIGDADPSSFQDLWAKACSPTGCDGGSPQTFDYNGIDGGFEGKMEGSFTMTGNVDNNQDWLNDLLGAINAAFQQTKTCKSDPAEYCALKKRESGPVADDCNDIQLTQCTMVNYIQATMYDNDSNQKAQVTMTGQSEPDSWFDCSGFLGAMSAAATGLDVAPPVLGALAFITLFCGA